MGSVALTSVQLPTDLVAQAAALASPGRPVERFVADVLERYLRDLAEYRRIVTKWRAESWEQGIRSEEDLKAVLDGTLTLEDLKRRA